MEQHEKMLLLDEGEDDYFQLNPRMQVPLTTIPQEQMDDEYEYKSTQARRRSERNPFRKNTREKPKEIWRTRRNKNWGEVAEKYWLEAPKTKREKWAGIIIYIGIAIGVVAMIGFGVWGYFAAALPAVCKLMDDDFRYSTIDRNLWKFDYSTGGGNAGSFEWTTDSTDNAFIKNNQLHIRPTLNTNIYADGTTVNLTTDGTCTDQVVWCAATQNSTTGSIINPVFSAKLSTKATMQYGSAEIKVKFPKGDWIWSQLILNPADNYYGAYPANGQVVIAQNRGNSYEYSQGGNDDVDSFLAFGPDGVQGLGQTLSANKRLKFKEYSDGFHVFGIQWTPKGVRTWVDDPVNTMLLTNWNEFGGFWEKGGWSSVADGNYGIYNPWSPALPSLAAPFDRHFYLTLQVGVGGMNGIFNVNQPWQLTQGRDQALSEFAKANTTWYKTWPEGDDRDMIVDYVRLEQQCAVYDPLTKKRII